MVEVFVSVFQDEALVVKSLLESAGLAPEMIVDGMLDVNPLFSVDIKGVRVCVSDEEAEDARTIVEEFLARRDSGESVAPDDDDEGSSSGGNGADYP